MMRRSKILRAALASLTWPDGSSRWDTTRAGCFHCGKHAKDLKRNVCPPCRTEEFVPECAPSSSVYAKGYRVCTDHCTTIPLPLHLFNNGNKKCKSCLDKRRMRKLKKRGVAVAPVAALSPEDYGLSFGSGVAAPAVDQGVSKRRRHVHRASTDAAADGGESYLAAAGAGVGAPTRSSRPSRLSALSARKRIAAIGADEVGGSYADDDDGDSDDTGSSSTDGTVTDFGGASSPSSSSGSAVVMPTPIGAASSSVASPSSSGSGSGAGCGAMAPPAPLRRVSASSRPIPADVSFPAGPPTRIVTPSADAVAVASAANTVFDLDLHLWSPGVVTPVPAKSSGATAAASRTVPRPAPPAPLRKLSSVGTSMGLAGLGTLTPLGATGLTPLFDWSAGLVSPSLARLL